MKSRWSIRSQALLLGLLPAVCIALLLAALFSYLRLRDADLFLQERGSAIAQRLAQASELGIFSGDEEVLRGEADRELRDPDVLAVRIRDRNGRQWIWHRPGAAEGTPVQVFPGSAASLVLRAPVLQGQIPLEDYPGGMAGDAGGATVSGAHKEIGEVAVEISRASTLRRQHAELLAGSLLALGCLLGAVVLALLLSARLIRPIRAMAGTVDLLAEGRLDVRLQLPAIRELAVLARGINRMADQVRAVQRGLEARVEEATRELTDQKRAAEAANAAKGRFLSAASHNVRQPMHAMGLFVDALKHRVEERESRHLLDCIEACAGSMGGLLNAVLDLSRLEAGVLTPEVRPFAISPLMFEVHLALSSQALEQGLSVRVVPTAAWVRSDPSIVQTILMNFLANAIRYTRRGGIVIGCRRRGSSLRIEVWDTGVGIAAAEQQRIFEDFYQVAGVARGVDRGLGLGLAVVRGLAELLDAQVDVRSIPGRGSVFGLTLPLASDSDAAPASLPDAVAMDDPGTLAGLAVLVVDDDRRILKAMEVLLGDWGCRVIIAGSLHEAALRVADAPWRPQVILSDFRLPGPEDGLGVVGELRARFGAGIPAILVTGDTEPAVLQAAESAGMPLLHKPIEPARLRAALTHARAQLPWIDP